MKATVTSAVFILCAAAAFGQRPPKRDSTVTLTNIPTAQTIKDMTGMVKSIADVMDVSFDEAHSAFALRAPENQLDLAAWLLHAADKPAGWQPAAQDSGSAADREYQLQPGGDRIEDREPITRIYYLQNSSPRDALEIQTVIRVVGEIRRLTGCDPLHMIVLRGTAAEVDLGDWMIQKLDLPASANASVLQSGNPEANTFKLPARPDGVEDSVRVFYLDPKTSAADIHNLTGKIRQTTNTLSVFSKTSPPTIVVRGSSVPLAQTQQILDYSIRQ